MYGNKSTSGTADAAGEPRFYRDFADWWPLLSPSREYTDDADFYEAALREACVLAPRTMLELGSGGGNNASFLKTRFEMTLVDPSPGMLAVSRALNPECAHLEGDMRTLELGRQFDAVFVHDAVVYMTSEADLRRAIATAYRHCRPGGAALFAPDHVRETFKPATDHGGYDAGGRGLRYLEWTWDPDPDDTTYLVDYAFMLRERDGTVQVVYDRHLEGLFSRANWLRYLTEAGFSARSVPYDHPDIEPGSYEIFLASKPLT